MEGSEGGGPVLALAQLSEGLLLVLDLAVVVVGGMPVELLGVVGVLRVHVRLLLLGVGEQLVEGVLLVPRMVRDVFGVGGDGATGSPVS